MHNPIEIHLFSLHYQIAEHFASGQLNEEINLRVKWENNGEQETKINREEKFLL